MPQAAWRPRPPGAVPTLPFATKRRPTLGAAIGQECPNRSVLRTYFTLAEASDPGVAGKERTVG
jgi:hypothetical protein